MMTRKSTWPLTRLLAIDKESKFVSFLKVEGAGNDFVLIDLRGAREPLAKLRWTRRRLTSLLDRHRGIGGDGLLVLRDSAGPESVTVAFWNPDASRAAFCGNGARCVARVLLGRARAEVSFRLGRVRVRARRGSGDRVRVLVPRPRALPVPPMAPPVPGADRGGWYDSGVPHWIVPVTRLDRIDLPAMARPLRHWPALGSGGTNVDLVEFRGGELWVRTFERGVEAETLACGSGLTAAGFWAAERLGLGYPLFLRPRGGDRLRLLADSAARGLWLEGPARVVCSGRVAIP